jgi:hypothetical protein
MLQNLKQLGTFNPNPMLNTRVYIAEFQDGSTMDYAANVMAKAIYNQVTDDGSDSTLFLLPILDRNMARMLI